MDEPGRLAAVAEENLGRGAPEPMFDGVALLAARAARVPVALVSLVERDRARLVGMCGMPQPWADARELAISHSLCHHVAANAAPLILDDARVDPVLRASPAITDLGVVAYAGFPIITPDRFTLGSLCAIDHRPRAWEDADLEALRELTQLVASEFERRGLVRRLTREAVTDALSGLANRRAWIDELPRAARRAERLGHPLAVVLLDIDHFADFNRRHGRSAGDQALRDVAGCWKQEVRDIDLLARVGGEEFGLLLPGCHAHAAVDVAGRLLAATPDGLTASAGVACWGAALVVPQLLTLADRALYRAKGDGCDCVVLSAPEIGPPFDR